MATGQYAALPNAAAVEPRTAPVRPIPSDPTQIISAARDSLIRPDRGPAPTTVVSTLTVLPVAATAASARRNSGSASVNLEPEVPVRVDGRNVGGVNQPKRHIPGDCLVNGPQGCGDSRFGAI